MTANPNQLLWEKGDFTQIAATMRAAGDALIERIGVQRGMRVLDLGSGDGTTALPSARRGADVLGVDIARNLVEAGNRRAAAEGLANLRFQHGDATDLRGLEDGQFDLVVSIFGAMFAPRPMDVAREMVRVTRKGGRIVMGNWIPGDPTMVAQLLRISAQYTPPPPEGFVSPMLWGQEPHVVERFMAAGASKVTCTKDTFVFESDRPASEIVEAFRDYYGPTMNAYEAAARAGRAGDLHREINALFAEHNQSTTGTRIPATFLRVDVAV